MGSTCCKRQHAKQVERTPLILSQTPKLATKYKSVDSWKHIQQSVSNENVNIKMDRYIHSDEDELLSDENTVGANECNSDPNIKNPTKSCQKLKSILNSLHHYEKLNISDCEQDLETFIEKMNTTDQALLDNYIHLNNYHSEQLHNISKTLKNCNVTACQYTSRHYRSIKATTKPTSDSKVNFYTQIMDSLHFYLHHCFDVGLRVTVEEKKETELVGIDKEKDRYFDAKFSRINRKILETANITKEFNAFSKDNKFNIKAEDDNMIDINPEHDDSCTYLDELCHFAKSHSIKQTDIERFKVYVSQEEYETECIEYDINITETAENEISCWNFFNINLSKTNNDLVLQSGNIFNNIQNSTFISAMQRCFKEAKKSSLPFSIGLRFYYWKYYKSLTELGEDEQVVTNSNINNYNDHSGYAVCNLFIEPRYNSFKEEICEYKHITRTQYEKKVVVKVNKYMTATLVKKTKAAGSQRNPYVKHYGIKWQDSIQFHHLLALVLYCDYSRLCTDFSSTFRILKKYETLKSVKTRNSFYHHFSKYLREAVEVYGQCSDGDYDKYSNKRINKLTGPFYSGVNKVLTIPGFNIRLCSPVSTSIHIEVAIKFSGEQGMILQFDNPAGNKTPVTQYSYLRVFNVSWISQYNEEDERLFFGGFYPVNIQSVRIRPTKQNFENFMYSLHYLDTMITGGEQADIEIHTFEISVIKNLFANALKKNISFRFDTYIYETFAAFIHNKKQIVLDLDKLFQADCRFRNLIIHRMNKHSRHLRQRSYIDVTPIEKSGEFTNLFRSEMLAIFHNVTKIIIKTTSNGGTECYSFSMVALLSLIESSSLSTIIIKANTHYRENEYNWINSLWHLERKQIKYHCEQSNYDICVTKHTRAYWLEITKKLNK